MTISSNANSVASVLLTANPLYSTVDMTGSSVTATGQNVAGNSTTIYSAIAQGALQSALSNSRVVGVGYRIKNLIPPTTATGRVIFAAVPCVGDVPGWTSTIGQAVQNNAMCEKLTGITVGTLGVSTSLGLPSSILTSPDSQECTLQDIIATTVQAVVKPISPAAFEFHNTSPQTTISGGTISGTSVTYSVAGVEEYVDNSDMVAYRGWETILLRFEGVPASSVIAEIEYVFHIEGTPAFPTSGFGVLMPDAAPKTHININGHNQILSAALGKKCFSIATDLMNGDLFSAGIKGAKMALGKKKTRQLNAWAKLGMSS
jgi:hypothetical protein